MAIFPYHRSLCLIIGLWLFLSLSTTSCLLAITINVLWRYEDNIRKISFHRSIQNLVSFCIEVGFVLYVCCYVKLIQQQIVSLLLLFGLSFILIYVERAITVKHLWSSIGLITSPQIFSMLILVELTHLLQVQSWLSQSQVSLLVMWSIFLI
jgi:hypothetical protein